ncbi:uncharacterized protein LOC127880916 isoform X2 [Dreissena polymorpha]|uniref:Uncharacterized protein n=2 Tax=Dreissena polymorpha TaxID=45954 RepID=A0A9D4H5I0_DREPO|nr:uncharacterized protein LOC127880916 isoform X2 [Dreissena polymorpha]KAH3827895.1 hypothetical protein DPMN_129841 [Dreissena polymorpha]
MNSADVGKILAATSTAKYFIEYGGFLSNHVSHGVIALHRLEASPDHIQRFVDDLLPKLEDTNSDKPDSRSFEELRGQRVGYYSLLQHYDHLLLDIGGDVEKLIREEYPKVNAGLAGSALHGTIHLGYAYAAGYKQGILEGLAYTYHSYRPVVSKRSMEELSHFGNGNTDILSVLKNVRKKHDLFYAMQMGSEKEEYSSLGLGKFQRNVCYLLKEKGEVLYDHLLSLKLDATVRNADGELDPVQLARRLVYWSTMIYILAEKKNDFFLLHGVTCAWALHTIIPILRKLDGIVGLRHYVAVLIAVYIAQGAPALTSELKTCDVIDVKGEWDNIVSQTLDTCTDEHCYKLVQVCREMAQDAQRYGEDVNVYMQAARNVIEHGFFYE